MNHGSTESDKKYHALFDAMNSGIAIYSSSDGQHFFFSGMNSAGEQMSDVTFRDIAGMEVREVFPGVVEMGLYDVFRRVWASGTAETLPAVYYSDQRISRYFENRVYKISDSEIAAVYSEITTQKKAEEELLRRKEQLRVIFEASQAGILMVEPSGAISLANKRMAEMFGYSMEELLKTGYPELVHPDQRNIGDDRMRKLITGEIDHVDTERHYIRADGSDFWGHLSGRRHEDAEGRLVSLIGHIIDITERKCADDENRKQAQLLDVAHDSIIVRTLDDRITYWNNGAVKQYGMSKEDAVGKVIHRLLQTRFPAPLDEIYAHLLSTDNWEGELVHTAADGSEMTVASRWVVQRDNEGTPIAILEINNDITEKKRAEEARLNMEQQLLHAQKLESLGVLAGGIAHDFNNILMSIIGNADLALMRVNRESPAVENLHRIEEAAAHAADLAKQMLAYSGKGKFVVDTIDLNILLEEMLHMLKVSISKKAVLRLNQYQPLPPVEADATQMRQIIMNLVINASEAIGDKSGVIAITTGCMDCDRSYLKNVWLDENLTDGLYVYLEIADSGCGMDSETLSKLFDPFFTTKFTGRGLGMAAVLGIVRGHKGAIKVYSEPGRGTTFKILLPVSGRPAETFNGTSDDNAWQGSGTVLLVDDEETIRGIGAEMLKELGFTVATAADGREAVEIFKSTPDISFVILDLTMPHMDGEQCFRELRQLKPDVKVIMSSGYNEQEVTQKFIGKGLAGFIQKPYRLSTLKEAIRGVV